MGLTGVVTGGVVGFSLVTVKVALARVSGVCGTERGLLGGPGVRTVSFGELSAVGLPKNPPDTIPSSVDLLNSPPCVSRAGTKGLPNKLFGGVRVGSLSC